MSDPRRTTGTAFTRAFPILYVDDELGNRLPFRVEFSGEFEVVVAGSGEEALAILSASPVAVLLTDHRMPGMTGVDLCERVRDRHPHVLRILVTAYSEQAIAIDAINRGGVLRYITKPWNPESVRQILREAVARASLERTVRKLRAGILDKERLAGVTSARARLLHDLAQANDSISVCCARLEQLDPRLRTSVDVDLYATYSAEIAELRRYVDYLSQLHDKTQTAVGFARPRRSYQRVAELLRTVVELVRSDLEQMAGLLVDCDEQVEVWADRTDVSRILVNLISNASRAVRATGLSEGRVGVTARKEGGTVSIAVWDDGAPLPEAFRDHLFDPYSGGPTTPIGRAGLQLAVCRELAIANGGTIEVAKLASNGNNAILVRLPAAEPSGPPEGDGGA